MHLALAINYEDGTNNSLVVNTTDRLEVYSLLHEQFESGYDEIFLIASGQSCPEVVEHFCYTD